MKQSKFTFLIVSCLVLMDYSFGQYSPYIGYIPTIPAERRVDWRNVGLHDDVPTIYNKVYNVRGYGAIPNDGIDDRQSIQNTIEAARVYINSNPNSNAVVYIPQGSYLLNSGLDLVNTSTKNYNGIIIKGDGSDKTNLVFPSTYKGKAISIGTPAQTNEFQEIYAGYFRDDQIIYTNTNGFNVGDYVELIDDFPLQWNHKRGQIEKIIGKTGTQLTLEHKLAINYDYGPNHPQIRKINPIKRVGIEDLRIWRHNTEGLWNNTIDFVYAADCWIFGIESDIAYKHHIGVNASTSIEIKGNYFHHASDYGEGGIGYGVLLENHTTNCLIEDNIFSNLRHSMIVQTAANRNVFGYNYSYDREWETWTAFPYIGTGDISVHANYPYANLFEGNKVALIWADDAHSTMNGPYNTFFRNDVAANIIYLNQAHYSNAVGNYVYEVDTDGGPIYPILGQGFSSNNVLDNGAKQYNPNGQIYNYTHADFFALGFLAQANSLCMDFSYYYDDIPSFIEQYDPYVVSWPCLGTTCYVDGTGQTAYWPRATIPASQRKSVGGKITLTGNSLITAPIISSLTSNPNPICQGSWATITCNLSQGYGDLKYYWTKIDFPVSYGFQTFGEGANYCKVFIPNTTNKLESLLGNIPTLKCSVTNIKGSSILTRTITPGNCGGCPTLAVEQNGNLVYENTLIVNSISNPDKDVTDYYLINTPLTAINNKINLTIYEPQTEHTWFDNISLFEARANPDEMIVVNDEGQVINFKGILSAKIVLNDTLDITENLLSMDSVTVNLIEGDVLTITRTAQSIQSESDVVLGGEEPPIAKDRPSMLMNVITHKHSDTNVEEVITEKFPITNFFLRPNKSIISKRLKNLPTGTIQIAINKELTLDYFVFVTDLRTARTRELPLVTAVHNVNGDIKSKLTGIDQNYAEMFPTQRIDLSFSTNTNSGNRAYILKTVGRYETDTTFLSKQNYLAKLNDLPIVPTENKLYDNYPNPFNPSTTIKYSLKDDGKVSLKIFNSLGEEVRTLVNEIKPAGNYEVEFNASNLPSGVYIYSIQSGDFVSSKKMILLK